MKSERGLQKLAGLLLAVLASVALTLPIHLSSPDHRSGECTEAEATGAEECLFVQFLVESFSEGVVLSGVAASFVHSQFLPEAPAALLPRIPITLPALRAPPLSCR